MFSMIKSFLSGGETTSSEETGEAGLAAAAVAVFVEAALLDGDFDSSERDAIEAI